MSQRQSALANAKRGLRVFRVTAGSKRPPLKKDWQAEATADRFAVYDLFSTASGDSADYNPGVSTTGLVVIDVDAGKGGLHSLPLLGDLPDTYTTETVSGGRHVYFDAQGIDYANSVGTLAPGIDVRAAGGYVLGAGARVGDKHYRVLRDAPIAPLPASLAAMLRAAAERKTAAGETLGETDTDASVETVRNYLQHQAPRGEEGNRNHTAYRVAARCYDYGVTQETCLELMREHWPCDPPLDDAELQHVVTSAHAYRLKPIGAENPADGFTVIEPEPSGFASRVRDFDLTRGKAASIAQRPWLAYGRLIRGNISLLVAPGAMGKSLLTLQWSVALALGGEDAKRLGLDVREATRVLVVNNEDPHDELDRRYSAIFEHWGIVYERVHGHIKLVSGFGEPIRLVRRIAKGNALERAQAAEEMIAYMQAEQIGVFIGDPCVSLHEGDENNNMEMDKVCDTFRYIAARTGAAVLLVHHSRKPGAAGSEGHAGNADAGRGASAIVNAARMGMTLFGMSEKDAKRFNVPVERKHRFVRLDDAKANLVLASGEAQWFERVSVRLPNGEEGGALVPVNLYARETEHWQTLAERILPLVKAQGEVALSTAAALLAESGDPLIADKSAKTLARELADAFSRGDLQVHGHSLQLERRGELGGVIRISAFPN